jgi:amino acid permease
MNPGSLRGSIFTLIATAIGAGVLTLPYVFKMVGLGLGALMMTVGMICNIWSCGLLKEAAFATKSKKYYQICQILGGKGLGIAYQVSIIMQQFGALVGYQIICNLIN